MDPPGTELGSVRGWLGRSGARRGGVHKATEGWFVNLPRPILGSQLNQPDFTADWGAKRGSHGPPYETCTGFEPQPSVGL